MPIPSCSLPLNRMKGVFCPFPCGQHTCCVYNPRALADVFRRNFLTEGVPYTPGLGMRVRFSTMERRGRKSFTRGSNYYYLALRSCAFYPRAHVRKRDGTWRGALARALRGREVVDPAALLMNARSNGIVLLARTARTGAAVYLTGFQALRQPSRRVPL